MLVAGLGFASNRRLRSDDSLASAGFVFGGGDHGAEFAVAEVGDDSHHRVRAGKTCMPELR